MFESRNAALSHIKTYGLTGVTVDYNDSRGLWEITNGNHTFYQLGNDIVLRFEQPEDSGGGGGGYGSGFGGLSSFFGGANIRTVYINITTLRGAALNGGYNSGWIGGSDVWGGFGVGSENGATWGEVKDWIDLRFSSPRNTWRLSFNAMQNVGEAMQIGGFVISKFTAGASIPTMSGAGVLVNSAGAVGNSLIDFYDGRIGSGFFSIIKHFAFMGFGNTARNLTGGKSDEIALEAVLMIYDKYILPTVGENYLKGNPNLSLERIEYKRY